MTSEQPVLHERADAEAIESLRVQYVEVCKSHNGITDFRAKLLALLPIASGAGFIILGHNLDRQILVPIGLYGAAVTLGLFFYELRGIQTCKRLRNQAGLLEGALRIPPEMGQFRDHPRAALGGLVGAEGASWTVYSAVIAGWIYLTGAGAEWWKGVPAWTLVILYVGVICVVWVRLMGRRVHNRPDHR